MKVSFHQVAIVPVAYEAGRTDDGHPFIAEAYQIWVTLASGDRWIHHTSFRGCEVCVDEEGYEHFGDVRVQALRQALRLRRRIRRAGKINDAMWSPGRPEYGSPAYEQYGAEEDRLAEMAEDGVR